MINKFKVGDKVRCIDNSTWRFTLKQGEIYEVSGFVSDLLTLKGTAHSFNVCRFEKVEEEPDEPLGHPHAHNMALYAEDAKKHKNPHKLWQYLDYAGEWCNLETSPAWQKDTQYRRKPLSQDVYMNVYKDGKGNLCASESHATVEKANNAVALRQRCGCVKVTLTEGEYCDE